MRYVLRTALAPPDVLVPSFVSMTCEHRDKAPPAGAAQRVSVSSVSTINTSRPHIKDEEEIQDTVVCTCRWNISLLLALLSVFRFLGQLLI